MVDSPGPRMPPKGEVKRRGEPPIGGGIKATLPTRLGRSTGSGTDVAGPTTWQPKRRGRCGGGPPPFFLAPAPPRRGGGGPSPPPPSPPPGGGPHTAGRRPAPA